MKRTTYILADNIISPLGFTTGENFERLRNMETGIKYLPESHLYPTGIHAGVIDEQQIEERFAAVMAKEPYTRLEKLAILSINSLLQSCNKIDITSDKTLIILSTTKGNIELLAPNSRPEINRDRIHLWQAASAIGRFFNNPVRQLVVSNACISGVLAIITAKRLLEAGMYDTAIVVGVDVLTPFVVSGFKAFKAVSEQIARPYDADRDGISLGEACGSIALTTDKQLIDSQPIIKVSGGASSNDANHISGPSRTGDGLLLAINKTLADAGVAAADVDYISGHGTATVFNDEMESMAVADAGLSTTPINSLKSYFGHTLGAAGVVEAIVGLQSMRANTLIGTYNYKKYGVSREINILQHTQYQRVNNCLKTAAGFGGCNSAVFFEKVNPES